MGLQSTLFLFVLALAGVYGQETHFCPKQGGAYAVCHSSVVYIIDTTVFMDPGNVSVEFDWLRYNIVPGTAWGTGQQLAFMSYGTGNAQVNPFTGNLPQACTMLDTLQNSYNSQGSSDKATLYQALQIFKIVYTQATVVLFSASTNATDIQQSADYINNYLQDSNFTIIALNGANFDSFPARVIYYVPDLATPPPNLPSCIIKQACETTQCNINGTTDAPVFFPTDAPTTPLPTTKTTTKKATTTKKPVTEPTAAPTAGTTKAPGLGPQCSCDWTKIWNDVMFLIDSSEAASNQGFQQMWGSVQTMCSWFTVQKTGYTASNYTMRSGVISYSNNAVLNMALGSVTSDDMMNQVTLPFQNGKNTNLESAIQMASQQFDTTSHRPNAQKVMLIVAASYNPGGVTAPQMAADTFKQSGGIIIVYNYVETHGDESPTLQEIASPGYYYSTLTSTEDDVQNGVCDANCFCSINTAPFSKSPRNTPTAGCYSVSGAPANEKIASNRCKLFNSGFLAYSESSQKTAFLSKQFLNPTSYWIGATFDTVDGMWEWSDGTPVGSAAQWAGGVTPNGSDGKLCVFIGTDNLWHNTDCRNGYPYPCEMPACDSTHYCG